LEVLHQPSTPESADRLKADRGDGEQSLGDRAFGLVGRSEIGLLVGLLLLTTVFAVIRSHHKHLWFDEIFTIIVATQPTLHRFVEAMPPEGNPPLNTLLVRLCVDLFGLHALVVRLPVLIGFLGSLVGLFVFVRRECGRVFGLLAVVLMLAEPGWAYAYEARPYGLMLGFLMLGLVSWQSAARAGDAVPPRPRGVALSGMAVAILGTILAHNIGIIVIAVPLLLGEGVRSYRRRRLDWPLLATGLAAVPGLAIIIPMAHRTQALLFSKLAPMRFSLDRLHNYIAFSQRSLGDIFSPWPVLLLAVVFLVWWTTGRRAKASVPTRSVIPAHIVAAAVGLLLLLPITWLAMMGQRGWYFCRYGIGSILAIAILTCFCIAGLAQGPRHLAAVLSFLLLIPFLHQFEHDARTYSLVDPQSSLAYHDTSGLPVMFSNPTPYPAIWWYAPAAVKDRIVYVTGQPDAPEGWAAGSRKLVETCLVAEKDLYPMPLIEYRELLRRDHFLVDVQTAEQSLKSSLVKAGYTATELHRTEFDVLYDMRRGAGAATR